MENIGAKLNSLKNKKISGYWAERILSQVEFGNCISMVAGGKFDDTISKTLDFISDKLAAEGAITRETALKTEDMIKALNSDAKKYNMICAAHAHIDMNWMWRWDETVSITLDTFRTMLDLMDEYPEFKFSQSQASVYRIVEEYDPEMLEEIRKRVKEGRWEVTASTWVEADKNIPNGESHARHILYTKEYLSKLLDIKPESLNIDFEPDTFGHSINIPEILSGGGVKYYYHCRGFQDHIIYKWVSPSGSSVIVYSEPEWYNSEIEPSMAFHVPDFCSKHGIDTMLKVYGVGDHGGGPTRRDIERLKDMASWPVFPVIKFGAFGEYFTILEKIKDKLPEVKEELNFVFTGCYTTQTRIKTANRVSEQVMNEAEMFSAVSSLCTGSRYSNEAFADAWKNVLFNHFHDIIPGSGTIDTREYAMGLFQKTLAAANSRKTKSLRNIAAQVDTSFAADAGNMEDNRTSTSEGAGVGFGIDAFKVAQVDRGCGKTRVYNFFNPSVYSRTENVELIVWDWNGDLSRMVFKDSEGNIAGHQLLDHGFNDYWEHKYMKVLVKAIVPACGYSTYVLSESENLDLSYAYFVQPRTEKPDEYILENDFIKVVFDSRSASIVSLVDKSDMNEVIGIPGGIFRYVEEDDAKGMTAWIVGRHMNVINLVEGVYIKGIDKSPLRQSLTYEIRFKSSKLSVSVSLDSDSAALKYDVTCDWHETGKQGEFVPQLGFYMPVGYVCAGYKYDVPFGVIERSGMHMDIPANSWVLGMNKETGKKSVMLNTGSRYGFRSVDDSMSITLIRSSYDPDLYPEFGIHRFGFSVGLVDNVSNTALIGKAYEYNHPVSVISNKMHKGTLPPAKSFITKLEGSVAVSAVKMSEDRAEGSRIIIRVYETEGMRTKAVFSLFKQVTKAYYVDICEKPVHKDSVIMVENGKVSFEVKQYSVANVCLEF